MPGVLLGLSSWIAISIARFVWRLARWRRSVSRFGSIVILAASAVSTVSCSSCESRLEADLRGERAARTAWTYLYEIRGIETPGIDPLRLRIEASYDAMPDLHYDRVVFEHEGRTLVEFNAPWFLIRTGNARLDGIRAGTDSPDWHRLLARDRTTLGAIVGALPEFPKSLADLEALTRAVGAPLELRIVDRRCR